MAGCGKRVVVSNRHDGSPIYQKCGGDFAGEIVLCDACVRKYQRIYPQGWRYYPGDVCRHGTYVGGCMEDHMCFYCEQGDDNG